MDPISASGGVAAHVRTKPANDEDLKTAARELESAFLAQMLKSAGFGGARGSMGGGAGEEQFASFLRQEHARALVDRGGIGLAEGLFHALKERRDGSP